MPIPTRHTTTSKHPSDSDSVDVRAVGDALADIFRGYVHVHHAVSVRPDIAPWNTADVLAMLATRIPPEGLPKSFRNPSDAQRKNADDLLANGAPRRGRKWSAWRLAFEFAARLDCWIPERRSTVHRRSRA